MDRVGQLLVTAQQTVPIIVQLVNTGRIPAQHVKCVLKAH
ncbi:hypothetical protein LSH36_283g03142, partial [Paralvinella palmiformis]